MDKVFNSSRENSFWSFKGRSPLMDSWPFFGTPFPVLSILAIYVIFVLNVGPKYMKHRRAYDLKWVIRIFNICQIAHNLFMIIRGFMEPNYMALLVTFGCYPITRAEDMIFLNSICRGYWHYFVSKLMDLADTWFFVLRKKQNQITFLHVYHHTTMLVMTWIVGKYLPGKEGAFFGLINACIHVLMYAYYTAASFGEEINNVHLKYKRCLTMLQIFQFIAILTFAFVSYFISCGYNFVVLRITMFQGIMNLILFTNFYIQKYTKSRTRSTTKLMVCTSLQMREHLLDENGNIVRSKENKEKVS